MGRVNEVERNLLRTKLKKAKSRRSTGNQEKARATNNLTVLIAERGEAFHSERNRGDIC